MKKIILYLFVCATIIIVSISLGILLGFVLCLLILPSNRSYHVDDGAPVLVGIMFLGAILGFVCGVIGCGIFFKKILSSNDNQPLD
jgi:hypothetical protein